MEYYSVTRTKAMRPFATTWMDLEVIMLNEITDTERQILFGLTYTRNLKKMDSQKQRIAWRLPGAGGWG